MCGLGIKIKNSMQDERQEDLWAVCFMLLHQGTNYWESNKIDWQHFINIVEE